jgi:hypothetical protein
MRGLLVAGALATLAEPALAQEVADGPAPLIETLKTICKAHMADPDVDLSPAGWTKRGRSSSILSYVRITLGGRISVDVGLSGERRRSCYVSFVSEGQSGWPLDAVGAAVTGVAGEMLPGARLTIDREFRASAWSLGEVQTEWTAGLDTLGVKEATLDDGRRAALIYWNREF